MPEDHLGAVASVYRRALAALKEGRPREADGLLAEADKLLARGLLRGPGLEEVVGLHRQLLEAAREAGGRLEQVAARLRSARRAVGGYGDTLRRPSPDLDRRA